MDSQTAPMDWVVLKDLKSGLPQERDEFVADIATYVAVSESPVDHGDACRLGGTLKGTA